MTCDGNSLFLTWGVWLALGFGVLIDGILVWKWAKAGYRLPDRQRGCGVRGWGPFEQAIIWSAMSCAVGLVSLVAGTRLGEVLGDWIGESSMLMVLHILLFHGLGLLVVVLLTRAKGSTLGETFGLRCGRVRRVLGGGVLWYLALLPPVLMSGVLVRVFFEQVGVPWSRQEAVEAMVSSDGVGWVKWLLVVAAAIVAPVTEELLFRGVLLGGLLRWVGAGPALVLASGVFAAMHMHTPSFIPLFVLGGALGLAYVVSGNLLVSMVMHALFNGVNLAILLWLPDCGGLS